MNRIYTIDIFELKSKMFDCAVAMLENEDITNDAVRDKLETLSEINGIIGDINKGIHSRKEHSKKVNEKEERSVWRGFSGSFKKP